MPILASSRAILVGHALFFLPSHSSISDLIADLRPLLAVDKALSPGGQIPLGDSRKRDQGLLIRIEFQQFFLACPAGFHTQEALSGPWDDGGPAPPTSSRAPNSVQVRELGKPPSPVPPVAGSWDLLISSEDHMLSPPTASREGQQA